MASNAPQCYYGSGLQPYILRNLASFTCRHAMHISRETYWRRQLLRTGILLVVWAVVGFGLSILFVEQLNRVTIGDMPLGFWMAQQGSIFVFIVLILLYAVLSGRGDRQAGLDESRVGRVEADVNVEPDRSEG